jgi:hypothetical protein
MIHFQHSSTPNAPTSSGQYYHYNTCAPVVFGAHDTSFAGTLAGHSCGHSAAMVLALRLW